MEKDSGLFRHRMIDPESWQYSDSSVNWVMRKAFYEHAVPKIDINEKIVRALGLGINTPRLSGGEMILDAGFGDAQLLIELRRKYGHRGILFGIDTPGIVDEASEKLKAERIFDINLIAEDVTGMAFEDASFDVVTALFMLYHTDPDKALDEIYRVLKPGGKAVIATSGEHNKPTHRFFEARIANHLDVEPPPRFNTRFNSAIARRTLPDKFDSCQQILDQYTPVHIPKSHIEDYYRSLHSMRMSYNPIPRIAEYLDAASNVVKPRVDAELARNGYLSDWVDRSVFICGKL